MISFHPRSKGNEEAFEQEIEVEGHLIDSMILTKIFDRIMDLKGDFEVLEFRIGKRKRDYSYVKLMVKGRDRDHLRILLEEMYRLGASPPKVIQAKLVPAAADRILPEDFYSTTSHPTLIMLNGEWIEVEGQMMDKVIVVDRESNLARCKFINEVKRGDLIVVGEDGIKVRPPERPREGAVLFEFMSSRASSEKPSVSIVKQIVKDMYKIKMEGGKIAIVAGPAIVHTGVSLSFAKMIRLGYVDVLLSGNALAVHDVENTFFGTSLGMNLEDGSVSLKGYRNHLAAINEITKAGSLSEAIKKGILKSGIMFECIMNNVPFALAGSIRDDGPLPDVITDAVRAQQRYKELLRGVRLVLMMASTLHSIAVGNLLPSTIKVVCVDINPAVVTKLTDRGTAQAAGIVSDVGAFLPLLVEELEKYSIK
ncbi:MAG: TIGR00300 family protein [Candidatus Methylarchaceae archaeon HK01M]|nr:TIGR00300 family protein [Candidatus Methylarchaceae archaeon HK01M]